MKYFRVKVTMLPFMDVTDSFEDAVLATTVQEAETVAYWNWETADHIEVLGEEN